MVQRLVPAVTSLRTACSPSCPSIFNTHWVSNACLTCYGLVPCVWLVFSCHLVVSIPQQFYKLNLTTFFFVFVVRTRDHVTYFWFLILAYRLRSYSQSKVFLFSKRPSYFPPRISFLSLSALTPAFSRQPVPQLTKSSHCFVPLHELSFYVHYFLLYFILLLSIFCIVLLSSGYRTCE